MVTIAHKRKHLTFNRLQRGVWGSLLVIALIALSGCTLLEGRLSVDQAVARLIPNDPIGVANAGVYIGELEIQLATQLWVGNKAVPRTGGQRISESSMERLILLWRQNAPIP